MAKNKSLVDMTDEELEARAADLLEQKRAIKAEERQVEAVLEARAAVAGLSDSAAKLVSITLASGLKPEGKTEVN